MIDWFTDKYFFLSNFIECEMQYEGLTFKSAEAAYQAMKTLDIDKRKTFQSLSPSHARLKGLQVDLRKDWDEVKVCIMYDIVSEKFNQNEDLKQMLIDTGDAYLSKGTWGETTWGVHQGVGENMLGKILMLVRSGLKDD